MSSSLHALYDLSYDIDLFVYIYLISLYNYLYIYLSNMFINQIEDWCFLRKGRKIEKVREAGIRRDGHLLFEVEMYLQKGCIMVSGVGSS